MTDTSYSLYIYYRGIQYDNLSIASVVWFDRTLPPLITSIYSPSIANVWPSFDDYIHYY